MDLFKKRWYYFSNNYQLLPLRIVGEITGYLGIAKDISQDKEAELINSNIF
jgi:PAS domain-containing protein